MDKVKMDHPGCNGWAVYDKNSVKGDDPKNIHVVEVTFSEDESTITVNNKEETICKQKLKPVGQRNKHMFATKDATRMRNYLVGKQNEGTRVCGTCVSRFYGDDVN